MTMRSSLLFLSLCLLVFTVSACEDSPTSTSTRVGKMTVEEFRADLAFATWFDHSYTAYPTPDAQATFTSNVASIKSALDTSHSFLMVVKPSCTCERTQQTMPAVLKVLDEAGFPHSKIDIYVTDARLAGFDAVKNTHAPAITDAPVFIVMKGGVEKGRISDIPTNGQTVEQVLSSYFAAP
ncbi:MAG: hypothetical protein H7X80_11740 [bacterium]|nr:hypothetical protein [Candidatus Kapabacteria bacterium]